MKETKRVLHNKKTAVEVRRRNVVNGQQKAEIMVPFSGKENREQLK
jgi:hypothetical protein